MSTGDIIAKALLDISKMKSKIEALDRAKKKIKEAEDSAAKQVRNAATLAGKLKATDRMDAKSEDEDSARGKMSEGDEESGT
jgi:hypothetical protein